MVAMKTGMLFSMEEFAVHDGPGIRTTIFLKGCPLRCAWCHNPEGISAQPQEMIRKGKRSVCGYEISSEALANRILRNKEVFRLNKGGITWTGGEPLFQSDFVIDVVNRIKPDIHVAMETSGYAPMRIFRQTVTLMDLVLFDVKHTDPVLHKTYTGVDNRLILKNLDYLCAADIDFVVRIPLIPGVNDTKSNMLQILTIIKDAPSLVRVEILPYHQTAGAKYAMIGRTYNPPFDPEKEPRIYNVFEENHIKNIVF